MSKNINHLQRVRRFLATDIWRIRLRHHSGLKSLVIKYLRVAVLSLREFNEDKCQLRASALTFYSLLSIVPVLAMVFGIAKGFGLEKILENQLLQKLQGQEEVVAKIIAFANTMLENTRGGLIAGIGVAVLFWTVIKVLANIENSFNEIWGVKKPRVFSRKLSDYLMIMLICPVLFITSSSATIIAGAKIAQVARFISFAGIGNDVVMVVLNILPYVVIWFLFTFIYKVMPNTKVNLSSALIAGLVAGTVYQVVQTIYVAFQVGVASYNAIYGSFAALPLFLVWLQLSWRIVLLGAEISFAHQNIDTYEFEPDCLKISYSFKKLVTLAVVHRIVKNFYNSNPPLSSYDISHALDIPIRLVRQVIFDLSEAGLICEVKNEGQELAAYQPARDVGAFTVKYVIDRLENRGDDNVPLQRTEEVKKIADALSDFSQTLQSGRSNLLLKDV